MSSPNARNNHPTGARTNRIIRARKGKLSGGIIALSSAAIVSIYALGRANTSAVSDQSTYAPTAAAELGSPSSLATVGQPTAPTVSYRDGSYSSKGTSRHGGMQVTVIIKDAQIVSANVTDCGTRYPCSDVGPLVGAAVTKQSVPTNHVSGASDSSKAYKEALTNALKLAKG